jgi:hypothetical protein
MSRRLDLTEALARTQIGRGIIRHLKTPFKSAAHTSTSKLVAGTKVHEVASEAEPIPPPVRLARFLLRTIWGGKRKKEVVDQ